MNIKKFSKEVYGSDLHLFAKQRDGFIVGYKKALEHQQEKIENQDAEIEALEDVIIELEEKNKDLNEQIDDSCDEEAKTNKKTEQLQAENEKLVLIMDEQHNFSVKQYNEIDGLKIMLSGVKNVNVEQLKEIERLNTKIKTYEDFEKLDDDGCFEPPHPIFLLAQENDKLKASIKKFRELLKGEK